MRNAQLFPRPYDILLVAVSRSASVLAWIAQGTWANAPHQGATNPNGTRDGAGMLTCISVL